jgi:hypothetical protein
MSEDGPQPQIVGLPLIDRSAVTFSPSIEARLSHHLWYTWAGLAFEHEAAAWAAREASLNQDPRDRDM